MPHQLQALHYNATRAKFLTDFPVYRHTLYSNRYPKNGTLSEQDNSTLKDSDLPRCVLLAPIQATEEQIQSSKEQFILRWVNNELSAYVQGDADAGGQLPDFIRTKYELYQKSKDHKSVEYDTLSRFNIIHNEDIYTYCFVYDKKNPKDWIINIAKNYHHIDGEFDCFISPSLNSKIRKYNKEMSKKGNKHSIIAIQKFTINDSNTLSNKLAILDSYIQGPGILNKQTTEIKTDVIDEVVETLGSKGKIEKRMIENLDSQQSKEDYAKKIVEFKESLKKDNLDFLCNHLQPHEEALYKLEKIYHKVEDCKNDHILDTLRKASKILIDKYKEKNIKLEDSLNYIEKVISHKFHTIENLNNKSLRIALKFIIDVEVNCKHFIKLIPDHKKEIVKTHLTSYKTSVYESAIKLLGNKDCENAQNEFNSDIKKANTKFTNLNRDKSTFGKAKRRLAATISNVCAAFTLGLAHALHKKFTGHYGFYTATNSQRELEKLSKKLESNLLRVI